MRGLLHINKDISCKDLIDKGNAQFIFSTRTFISKYTSVGSSDIT